MALHTFIIGNITVTVDLPTFEESILADQVVGPDAWVGGFANHVLDKVEAHKQRMISDEIAAARAESRLGSLAATDDAIVLAVLAKPDYKNRAVREAEAKAAAEAQT